MLFACGSSGNTAPKFQCSDGKDNDGDGLIDFPDDPGCTSPDDNSEDSLPAPQCSDGRDNDGDGKIDYPNDPGCFAPQQDDETDDCPDGPSCPQCSNGKDDDNNGKTDYPDDPGCSSAADNDEYTENPVACGQTVNIQHLPFGNEAMGMIGSTTGQLDPATTGCLGTGVTTGTEAVYEIRLNAPKVVVASTANDLTQVDTVVYIRSAMCTDGTMEVACNDNAVLSPTVDHRSTVTVALDPGTYYVVVDYVNPSSPTNPPMGTYDLTVHFFVGEGVACQTGDDCGPGLVCRIPLGGTTKVCSKHVCSDGVDDDGDGKLDYPTDPGCTSPTDDDETDDCPNGPMCPECGNGIDDDGDGHIDYPADPTCKSASDVSEACPTSEGVTLVTMATTTGDTTTAVDDVTPSCAFAGAHDLTYRIDVPHLDSLSVGVTTTTGWDDVVAIYDSTCTGTDLQCQFFTTPIAMTNVAAGVYYVVVDSDTTGTFSQGPFSLNVSGHITNGASCENQLSQAGAFTCNSGYACKGTVGSRTCQPALCSDGIDNDGDGKIDYPFDPGCDSPGDDTENDPATEPVCADGMDNDGDGTIDFPADYGCAAASGTSEVFCIGETDPTSLITTATTTGTTAGAANDIQPGCSAASVAPDKVFALQLPVSVQTLTVDLLGSSYDTVLTVRDASCAMELGCDDDTPNPFSLQSTVVLTNLTAGGYAIDVDGYSSNSGAFTLNVHGVVAAQTPCSSPMFMGGNPILTCVTGTSCTGSPKKCQ